MQDKLMWFPKVQKMVGAGVLALGLVAALNTPAFAKGVTLNRGTYPSMLASKASLMGAAQPSDGATVDATSGVVIVAIDAEGPAAQAGIARGDILLTVGDVSIDSAVALYGVVVAATPGDELTLFVHHGDEPRTIPVTLGSLALGDSSERAYLGVQVVDLAGSAVAPDAGVAIPVPVPPLDAPAIPAEAGVMATEIMTAQAAPTEAVMLAPGLIVAEVIADGPAAQAGLVAGDLIVAIDGVPVSVPDDFVNALQGHTPGEVVSLTVQKVGPVGAAIAEVPVTLGAAPDDAARAYLGIHIVSSVQSAVTIQMDPATGAFTAPAIPFDPSISARPEMAPGYAYPGAYASGACGPTTINQYFYAPVNGSPYWESTSPTVAPVPALPPLPALPAVPAAPFFIYNYGDNAGYATTTTATASVELMPGQAEGNVIYLHKATPTGAETQSFTIQMQPGSMQAMPAQAMPAMPAGDVVYYSTDSQVVGGEVAKTVTLYKESGAVQVAQPYAGESVMATRVVAPDVAMPDVTMQRQVIIAQPAVPMVGVVAGEAQMGTVVVSREGGHSVTIQALPVGGMTNAVPVPVAGVAVPQAVPVVPALPVVDAWY